MLFSATLLYVVVGLATNQVVGAAIEAPRDVAAVLIATSPYYACNCPNNCSYKPNTGCRYKAGPSTNSETVSGKCEYQGSQLMCVAT